MSTSQIQRVRDALLTWYAAGCPADPRQQALDINVTEKALTTESEVSPASVRLVVLLMTHYARSDGSGCFPSRMRLQRQAGVSARTVDRARTWAVKHGWLVRVVPGNQYRASVYAFQLPPVLASSMAHANEGARATSGASKQQGARAIGGKARATSDRARAMGGRARAMGDAMNSSNSINSSISETHTDDDDELREWITSNYAPTNYAAWWPSLPEEDRQRIRTEYAEHIDQANARQADIDRRTCGHGVINGAALLADGSSVGGCMTCEMTT